MLLALLYTGFYLGDPALPGNDFNPCCTSGWIGWWDQGLYYTSAQALAARDFSAGRHWYPLGYAMLAAPFAFLRSHQFFLVDLGCLLLVYKGFIAFAGRLNVRMVTAAILFLLSICADPLLFRQWAVPWTTTPSAAAIWLLLATAAAHLQGASRRPFIIGLLAIAVPVFRPTDALVSAIVVGWVGLDDIRLGRLRSRDIPLFVAGVAMAAIPYAILHVTIYGSHSTTYMAQSKDVGFTLHNPLWRAYVLLIEPRQWYLAGQGVMARMPWLLFGFGGALYGLRSGKAAAMLAVALFASCSLYLAFVDLSPANIWKYMAVHYFKWTIPGLALLGWLLVVELYRCRVLAWGVLMAVFLMTCIRVTPRLASPAEPALAIDLLGVSATEGTTTFASQLAVEDLHGKMRNVMDMRGYPFPTGNAVRLIALTRDFVGPLDFPPDNGLVPAGTSNPVRRWAEHIGFGYPCWLPPYRCKKPQPEPR